MIHIVDQRHADHVEKPLPIANGGTGAKTAQQALINLNAIPLSDITHVNGPVPLDINVKIPLQYLPDINAANISIMGPSIVYERRPTKFWITDYDIDKNYVITATHCVVTRDWDVLTLIADTGVTAAAITIDGVVFNVIVQPSHFLTPIITNIYPNQYNTGEGYAFNCSFSGKVGYLGKPPLGCYLAVHITISTTPDFSAHVINDDFTPNEINTFSITGIVPDYPDFSFQVTESPLKYELTVYYYQVVARYLANSDSAIIETSPILSGSLTTPEFQYN